jgi:hypothetical protein
MRSPRMWARLTAAFTVSSCASAGSVIRGEAALVLHWAPIRSRNPPVRAGAPGRRESGCRPTNRRLLGAAKAPVGLGDRGKTGSSPGHRQPSAPPREVVYVKVRSSSSQIAANMHASLATVVRRRGSARSTSPPPAPSGARQFPRPIAVLARRADALFERESLRSWFAGITSPSRLRPSCSVRGTAPWRGIMRCRARRGRSAPRGSSGG